MITVQCDNFVFSSAEPQVEELRCNKTIEGLVGRNMQFICGFISNPKPTSYALRLPGEESDLIESEDEPDNFDFETKSVQDVGICYSYIF